jgi:photosystem II stability/assembly factor-like uncharacterized protein
MSTPRFSHWLGKLAIAGLMAAGVARAGVNTWTGSSPAVAGRAAIAVATDPRDPYRVYAVFWPGDLYRSADGGRTWAPLARFDVIYSLLVHPSAPDTLYMGVYDAAGIGYSNVVKSTDGGATWTRSPASEFSETFSTLVGSPTDPGVVYAAAGGRLFRTPDGGATWVHLSDLVGVISSLVIHPDDPSTLYAGSDGDAGDYYPFGAFAESTNRGGSWTYATDFGVLDHVAVALDAANPSTLFLGLARVHIDAERGVRRSTDGGATWSRLENGLPLDAEVESIAVDPARGGTVYAGTRAGIYRSRDSGETWLPFSQILADTFVSSLALSPDGRSLLAATERGAFSFEAAEGPIDVAATGGGSSGVLRWSADRLAVQTLAGSGNWSASPVEEPAAAWHAIAAASSGDGRLRVLWQAGDGRSAVEVVGAGGRESVIVLPASVGWMPVDISAGAGGAVWLLFTHADGAMCVASLDASGSLSPASHYGPTGGWSAAALADAPDGRPRVLWRNADGRSALSIHGGGGRIEASFKWDASADGAVADLAVGADEKARILVRDAANHARIWTVGVDGSRSAGDVLEVAGLSPQRIAAAADGGFRVLWADGSGRGTVSVLNAGGAVVASYDVPALP